MNSGHARIAGFTVLALVAGFGLGKFARGSFPKGVSGDLASSSGEQPAHSSLLGPRTPRNPDRGSISPPSQGALAEEIAWLEKIEGATLADLPALFAEAEKITGKSLRRQVRDLLLLRWLELDPEDALAAARQRKADKLAAGGLEAKEATLRELFRIWARVDPEGALAAAEGLEDEDESKAAYQALANGRSEVDDPLEFLEFVKSLPASAPGEIYAAAITRLAETDRDRAIAEAIDLPWNAKMVSLGAVFRQWSEDDPHAALEATAAHLSGKGLAFHDRSIASVLPELARIDPDLAGERYGKLHAPNLDRAGVLRDIVDVLAREDPLAAAAWLGEHGERNHVNVIGDLIGDALVTDPSFAVDLYNAAQSANGPSVIYLRDTGNPAAALDAITSLRDSFGKQRLQTGLLTQWASRDFHAAASYAENLTPGGESFENLYRDPGDLEGAWDHAIAHRDALPGHVFHNLLQTIADTDPDLAVREFQTLPQGEFRDAAGLNLAGVLARISPHKAAEFAATLPANEFRNEAIRRVANRFATDDPFAASEWVDTLAGGAERDLAAGELVEVVRQFDPRSAFIWATDIENDGRRNASLDRVVRSWAKTDPAAAAAQIRASAMPDEQKAALLEMTH